ncbi:MAG: hypothetical protein AB8U25_03110 [Rickettsiales endosymbiont of Dermacentor nuttalli]
MYYTTSSNTLYIESQTFSFANMFNSFSIRDGVIVSIGGLIASTIFTISGIIIYKCKVQDNNPHVLTNLVASSATAGY